MPPLVCAACLLSAQEKLYGAFLAAARSLKSAPLFRQQCGEHGSNDGYVLVHKPLGPDGWPGFDAQ